MMERPLSPFLRLLIGATATALAAEFARFQADLAWAALPVGAGAVITLAQVARGVRARRRWRHELIAARSAEAAERDVNGDLPVPRGADASPLAAPPRSIRARRDDPASFPEPDDDTQPREPSALEPSALEPSALDPSPVEATSDVERRSKPSRRRGITVHDRT